MSKWIFNLDIVNEKDFMGHFECESVEEALDNLKEDLNMEFAGVYGGIIITGVEKQKDDFGKFMNEPIEDDLDR